MTVGNDIVDLTEAGTPHPRFADRVLAQEEKASFAEASDPTRELWRRWAAKEAAYKVARSARPDLPFHPKDYVLSMDRAFVTYPGGRLAVFWQENERYVFCRVTTEAASMHATDAVSAIDAEANPSTAARELARRHLEEVLGISGEMRFEHGPGGEPRVYVGERELSVALSFTHHGSFVAVSRA